jgi:YHS domain-containing protein
MMAKSVVRGHTISPGVAIGSLCYSEMLFICPADAEAPLDRKPDAEMKRFQEEVASLIKDLVGTVDALESESFSASGERKPSTTYLPNCHEVRLWTPICRMIVSTEETPYRLAHQGRRYFFCTPSCLVRFQKEAEKWSGSNKNEWRHEVGDARTVGAEKVNRNQDKNRNF